MRTFRALTVDHEVDALVVERHKPDEALETGDDALEKLLARIGPDVRVVRTRAELISLR